jgi:hypothetical protein
MHNSAMHYQEEYLVYPDGERQEAPTPLRINQIVDLNGYPLSLPLKSAKIIAYEVTRISRNEKKGETIVNYHLSLLNIRELESYLG